MLGDECLIRQKRNFVVDSSRDWQPMQFRQDWRDVLVFSSVGDDARKTVLETLKFGKIRLRRIVQHRVAIVQSCRHHRDSDLFGVVIGDAFSDVTQCS